MNLFGPRCMIVAPHADDEWFGAGGILLRFQQAVAFTPVLVCAGDIKFRWNKQTFPAMKRWEEFNETAQYYTRAKPRLVLDMITFPDAESRLDTIPKREIVSRLDEMIDDIQPSSILIPSQSTHQDHRVVYDCCMSAIRPAARVSIPRVFLYEEPGGCGIHDVFHANVHLNVTEFAEDKLRIFRECYGSQYSAQERGVYSENGLRSYMQYRGSEVGVGMAECLELVRWSE